MKWYITIHRPKMKAKGGAFWPIMMIKDKNDKYTIDHEEVHMKGQLWMLLLPWIILYSMFLILYGYYLNPFERWARAVENKKVRYKPFGWVNYL